MRTTTPSRQLTVRVQAATQRKPPARGPVKKAPSNVGAADRTLWLPNLVRRCA